MPAVEIASHALATPDGRATPCADDCFEISDLAWGPSLLGRVWPHRRRRSTAPYRLLQTLVLACHRQGHREPQLRRQEARPVRRSISWHSLVDDFYAGGWSLWRGAFDSVAIGSHDWRDRGQRSKRRHVRGGIIGVDIAPNNGSLTPPATLPTAIPGPARSPTRTAPTVIFLFAPDPGSLQEATVELYVKQCGTEQEAWPNRHREVGGFEVAGQKSARSAA
jgi:hypothetical protein